MLFIKYKMINLFANIKIIDYFCGVFCYELFNCLNIYSMKKIFTFIFVSVLTLSCWGTEVTIGSGSAYNSSLTPYNTNAQYSISQCIYTADELSAAGLSEGAKISKIAFKSGSATVTRVWDLYITHRVLDIASKLGASYYIQPVTDADNYFSGEISTATNGNFTQLILSKNFVWDGTSHLCITLYDKTGTSAGVKYAKVTTGHPEGRSIYTSGNTEYKPKNSSSKITCTNCSDRPIIQITYTTGGAPVPSLTATCSQTNFGIFAKDYEVKQSTITVTGENLTEDVSITADAGMSVSPINLSKEAVMADGGAIVTVTTTNAFMTNKKVTVSANSLSKSITFIGEEAVFTDRLSVAYMNNQTAIGGYANLTAASTKIESVDASNHSFVIGTLSTATIDYESVPGTYVANGTISGLKVKKTGESAYKAFAFNYTAPVVTGITIDENADNSAVLAAKDGQSVTVNFTRSLTQGMYNTICLPIALNVANVSTTFGYDCSLISLASSTYKDGVITLNFEDESELEAGKPYLVQPTKAVTNPVFNSWLVSAELHPVETTYADFIPVFSPTVLEQSKSILFLGADNELFWPTEAGTIKGLRCYFRVHVDDSSIPSGAPVRMVIGRGTPTDISQTADKQISAQKVIENGHIFIERNGVRYNLNGQIVK